MKKKLSIIVCLLLMVCVATGCTTFNNFKNAFFSDNNSDSTTQEKTIKIGVYEPLSGEQKEKGIEEKIGIELAHELYPEAAGKKVELIYADNQSDMYVAETVIQELVAQNPSIILGSYGDILTLIAGDAVKANNIPAITITSTNPLITINNPYYFVATFAEERQGDALAEFACVNQNISKVATVKVSGDDTVTATIKRFTDEVKNLTANDTSVVGSYELPLNSTDYSSVIEKIKASDAQAVYVAVSPTVATEFLKQAVDAELTNVLFLGTKNWNDEKLLKYVTNTPSLNIAYASDYSADIQETEMAKEFIKAYKEKYGEDAEPTEATAIAFDAYVMAIKAIDDAYANTMSKDLETVMNEYSTDAATKGAVDDWTTTQETGIPTGKAIREALANINDFKGASGTLSYDGTNEAIKSMVVNHIYKGKVQENYIVE